MTLTRHPSLPEELVAAIFEYVPLLADLRRAASVSRNFYFAAQHAGLYIPRRVFLYRRYKDDNSLQVLREVVKHALAKDLRLSLSLEWRPSYCSKHADDLAICTAALALLKASLPVLVSLRLGDSEPREALEELNAALRSPAPRLRSLQLAFCSCLDDDDGAPPLITPSLFAGSAPRLSELGAECLKCNLGSESVQIPVFAKVSRLQVRYRERLPALKLNMRLPHLSTLELVCQSPDLDIPIDLSGLWLKSLIFHDVLTRDAVPHPPPQLMTLESAPEFHYIGQGDWRSLRPAHLHVYGGRTDDNDSGSLPVNVRLAAPSSDRGVVVSVVAADTGRDRAWRQSYYFRTESADAVVRNLDSPGLHLHARIAYLRLSTAFLSGLLLHCATAFPVLTKIRVDVTCDQLLPREGPFINIGRTGVGCRDARSRFPQLALIAIVWCGSVDADEAARHPTVPFEELEIVARALAPVAGPSRPALHFVGLDVELRGAYVYDTNLGGWENVVDPLEKLFRPFSEVTKLESAGPDDEGMWEERGSLHLADLPSMHCLRR